MNCSLNQADAAKLIGVSKTTLSSWENYATFPTVIDLPAIEKTYNVKYNDIIFLPPNYALSAKAKMKRGETDENRDFKKSPTRNIVD